MMDYKGLNFDKLRGYSLTDRQLDECNRNNVPVDAVTAYMHELRYKQNNVTDDLIEDLCGRYMGEYSTKESFATEEAERRFGKETMDAICLYFNDDYFVSDIFDVDYVFVEGLYQNYVFRGE